MILDLLRQVEHVFMHLPCEWPLPLLASPQKKDTVAQAALWQSEPGKVGKFHPSHEGAFETPAWTHPLT